MFITEVYNLTDIYILFYGFAGEK